MFVKESTPGRKKVYEQKNAIQKDSTLGNYYINEEKFKTMQSFVAEPGDIIVSCAGTIGEIYILPKEAEIGVINQALMRIKLFRKEIEQYFILYFDSVLKKEANDKGNGTGMKNIPPFDVLKKMLLPLPPEQEIKRILEKIETINSKISIIANSFKSLFDYVQSAKSKILDSIFGQSSSYKSYYKKTEGKLIDFCSSITKGSTPTTYGFNYQSTGISFIKVENVNNGRIDHSSINQFISEEAHIFQKRSQLKENDILYSIAGTIGKTCIIQKQDLPANTNQAFAIISGYEKYMDPNYLFLFLQYIAGQSGVEAHGGGMDNATLGGLKKLNIWFPSFNEDQMNIVKDVTNKLELLKTILN